MSESTFMTFFSIPVGLQCVVGYSECVSVHMRVSQWAAGQWHTPCASEPL